MKVRSDHRLSGRMFGSQQKCVPFLPRRSILVPMPPYTITMCFTKIERNTEERATSWISDDCVTCMYVGTCTLHSHC